MTHNSLEAPGFDPWTYSSDLPVSRFAFKWVNSYRYSMDVIAMSVIESAAAGSREAAASPFTRPERKQSQGTAAIFALVGLYTLN